MDVPTFYIKTFGCQMNKYDTDALADFFAAMGLAEAASPEDAALAHIHTCCVRQKAEDKFHSLLGEIRLLKERRPGLVIGVGGCIAEKEDLRARYSFIDYAIGAGDPAADRERIEKLVAERIPNRHPSMATGNSSVSRFIAVIRGCSNYCTYCVVPYVRGRETSREPGEIRTEAEKFAESGAREIILLGQNVLAYGLDLVPPLTLLDALRAVHDIDAIRRVRFVTSHPAWVTEDFLRGLADLPKVCEHFHIPFQAGDDEVLRRMNRRYTSAEYEAKVALIRRRLPGASITADVIVGFPGETEEQFRRTLELIERVRPDSVYSFKYSTRPGTAAARMEEETGDAPLDVKKDRLRRLNELHNAIARELNNRLVGETVEVMVDETVAEGRFRGRTRNNRIVDFTSAGPLAPGDMSMVEITRATPHALIGKRP